MQLFLSARHALKHVTQSGSDSLFHQKIPGPRRKGVGWGSARRNGGFEESFRGMVADGFQFPARFHLQLALPLPRHALGAPL